jgi:hypothetical protein
LGLFELIEKTTLPVKTGTEADGGGLAAYIGHFFAPDNLWTEFLALRQ